MKGTDTAHAARLERARRLQQSVDGALMAPLQALKPITRLTVSELHKSAIASVSTRRGSSDGMIV